MSGEDSASDYRIRPRDVPIDDADPLRFRARTDDEARGLFRIGTAVAVARGLPSLPMVLERFDPIDDERGQWVTVRVEIGA